jgi:hypothetical protein
VRRAGGEPWLSKLVTGGCHTNALRRLEAGGGSCDALSEGGRHRLALALADCFLAASGRGDLVAGCAGASASGFFGLGGGGGGGGDAVSSPPPAGCMAKMSPEARAAYLEYFVNLHAICAFLQNESFKEQTAALVTAARAATPSAHAAAARCTHSRRSRTPPVDKKNIARSPPPKSRERRCTRLASPRMMHWRMSAA